MDKMAKIELDGKVYEFPCVVGSENEKAINISSLRAQTGYITLDEGYMNTGSCQSAITYIDGENGILRYRGIPIEELAEKVSFIEVAYLLVMGYLPNPSQLRTFSDLLTRNQMIHEDIKIHFEGFPSTSHPMAILSAMINASRCFFPELADSNTQESYEIQSARLIAQVRTIAAFSYRKSRGLPIIYPKPFYRYTANFLHMMFSEPYQDYEMEPEAIRALDMILLFTLTRAKLFDFNGKNGGIFSRKPFCKCGGRGLRIVGTASRRCQPGRDRDAGGDRKERR